LRRYNPVLCVRQSGDGECLLAGMLGSRLALLDRSSGDVLAEYRGMGLIVNKHSTDVESTNRDCTYV
jgi:mitogen-activated protein kinase organizer 1